MKKLLSIIGMLCAFSVAQSAEAAAFLKYGDIQGEVTDSNYQGWIELVSLDFGFYDKGNKAAGVKATQPSLDVVLVLDRATPDLITKHSDGLGGGEDEGVDIAFTRSCNGNEVAYLTYKLDKVFISSISTSVNGGSQVSLEPPATTNISLNFTKIGLRYTPYDDKCQPGQPVTFTYDGGGKSGK